MAEFKKRGGFGGGAGGGFKRSGGRPSFGGKPGFFKRPGKDGEDRPMYPATCSRCSKACEVPFRPNGEKPVLCRDCFRTDQTTTGDRPSSGYPKREGSFGKPAARNSEAGNGDLKKQLELINIKLDKLIQILKEASAE